MFFNLELNNKIEFTGGGNEVLIYFKSFINGFGHRQNLELSKVKWLDLNYFLMVTKNFIIRNPKYKTQKKIGTQLLKSCTSVRWKV